jgi:hypothetical protein
MAGMVNPNHLEFAGSERLVGNTKVMIVTPRARKTGL